MRLGSTLLFGENRFTKQSDPHVTGVLTIPWSDVGKHPKLLEIGKALSKEDRQACKEEGVLRLTSDYGFEEEYKEGVGLVMRDLNVDVDKLSDSKKEAMQNWLQTQYGAETTTDEYLQRSLCNPEIKDHIIADMTVAGMGLDAFKEVLSAHAEQSELPYPLETQDIVNIVQSMQKRGIQDIDSYYNDVAMNMREQWPSATNSNYGHDEPGKASVVFFTGFSCMASMVIKAGPYAYQPAWPDLENGFGDYNENGVGLNEDGDAMAASEIEMDPDYIYHPYLGFSRELEGKDASDAIDRWFESHENPPNYDGMEVNCFTAAGHVCLGKGFPELVRAIARGENLDDPIPKVTDDMILTSMLEGVEIPEGINVTNIQLNHKSLTQSDIHGIRASMYQVEHRDADTPHLCEDFSSAVLDIMAQKGVSSVDAIYQCDQAHLDV